MDKETIELFKKYGSDSKLLTMYFEATGEKQRDGDMYYVDYEEWGDD